jgi:hypothetical protein
MRDTEQGAQPAAQTVVATVSCLRCGATYPMGAVVCFSCGAPIGNTSIPTQPVNRAFAMPPPPPAPPVDELPATTKRRATQPPLSQAQRRSRRWRVAAGLFFTVLIVLASVGVAQGIRAIVAAPPVSHVSVYHDPQHRFHFDRPTLWTPTSTGNGVLLTDSGGVDTVTVSISKPGQGESASDRADSLASAKGLSGAPTRTFVGTDWQQRAAQVIGADGAVRQDVVLVALHGGSFYVIELSSPIANYASMDNLVYEPLLASFQFD